MKCDFWAKFYSLLNEEQYDLAQSYPYKKGYFNYLREIGLYEIYEEVCDIGKRGNVLVLRSSLCSDAMLYSGRKEECPYSPDEKIFLGKYYYIENV